MSETFIIELKTPNTTVEEMEDIKREMRKRIRIAVGLSRDWDSDEDKYNSIW